MADKQRLLLPTNAKPVSYTIRITPDLQNFTFSGTVDVELQVNQPTHNFTFHTLELEIQSATFQSSDGTKQSFREQNYDKSTQQTVLAFENEIKEGKGNLIIGFTGILNDKMAGLYRSKYVVDGQEKYMAVTQFEATDARRAFPCWDEPALKATFNVYLTIPSKLKALSNMPIVAEKKIDEETVEVQFGTTPIMSTYLLAMVVGEFDYLEDKTKEGVIVRVYTPLGKADQGKFALDVATKTLSFYTEYFGIPYPLEKSDMIAIADFASGAMENWGLITYRETALLIEEGKSGILNKRRVAYVVAHELAHQWFGNLVTMEWWKELWLNEGFATWVGNLAVDKFFPSWDIWTQFTTGYISSALSADSLLSTHPIEVEVYNSEEIDEIFDSISYNKGASIIRMIADYLGEEAFKKGLNIYLNRHQYANAVTTDLWNALSEASGKNVNEFMNNWTTRPGFPVIRIEPEGDSLTTLKLTQERFLASGEAAPAEEESTWSCSISFISSKRPNAPYEVILNEKQATITLPDDFADNNSWIKANANQSGFFRVLYDPKLHDKIASAIKNQEITSSIDKIGLLSDALALARAGKIKTSLVLKLATSFTNESDYSVLEQLASVFGSVAYVWADDKEIEAAIKTLKKNLFNPILQKMGWTESPSDSDLDKLLRKLAIGAVVGADDEQAVQQVLKIFDDGSIPADIRTTVYAAVVKHRGEAGYESVLQVYESSDNHSVKVQALSSLGSTKDPELAKRLLDYGLSGKVRNQDIFYATPTATTEITNISWKYFQDHRDDYATKLSNYLFASVIGSVTGFNTFEKADEVEKYFKEHPVAQERSVSKTLEGIRNRAKWLNRDNEDVKLFFSSQ